MCISYKNDLSNYVSSWITIMKQLGKTQVPAMMPQEIISYSTNKYDLSLMLSYLNDNLTVLENMSLTPEGFDYLVCTKTRVFMKATYIFVRVVIDDLSGVIKYFYDKNEPSAGVPISMEITGTMI